MDKKIQGINKKLFLLAESLEMSMRLVDPKETSNYILEIAKELEQELSKTKDTEILDWIDKNIVGGDDKNFIEHYITSPLMILFNVKDEKISEAEKRAIKKITERLKHEYKEKSIL